MSDLIRAAYVAWAPFISGAERSLQTLLRHLPAARVEPLVIGPAESRIAPWCAANGVPFHACPLAIRDKWHPIRWWQSVRRMRHLLLEQRVDVVHCNQVWSFPAAGAAAGSLGLPRVCHVRDETSPEAFRWYCGAGVEAIVCISQHIERQARAAWPAPPRPGITTRLNPVEMPLRGDAGGAARRASDGTTFGFIGQIAPVKGVLELIDALADLADVPGWRLLVAGRDPHPADGYEARCRTRVSERGLDARVRWLGFLDNVGDFYRAVDLVVVPSREEPLGRVPLEAAAYAKPAVAFAVGGLPETIDHGRTGWLVQPGDVAGLREVLRAFLDKPSAEVGPAARAWVESACDPTAYARQMAALYTELRTARTAPEPGVSAESRMQLR